jgi:PERQ amino acid-rich with GYF domain-containing protein
MIESIKFGPEWLRNTVAPATSGGGSSNDGDQQPGVGGGGGGGQSQSHNGANATKYPLAEFRYYREEMLSLFDINVKLPEILPKFKKLYVEKVQFPLAFSPPTEEEAVSLRRQGIEDDEIRF